MLQHAADLKRLGIDPDVLLDDEVQAEKAWRQLRDLRGLDVPGGLRALVSPFVPPHSYDALDAPSLRDELKAARAIRNHFPVLPTRRSSRITRMGRSAKKSKARLPREFRAALELFRVHFDEWIAATDLDACAEALRLRPRPGTKYKTIAERELEATYYLTYLVFQEVFRRATGATAGSKESPEKFAAENRRLLVSPMPEDPRAAAALEQLGKAALAKACEHLLVPALKRQVDAFNRERKEKIGASVRLSASERCALAVWEALRMGPADDEHVGEAMTLIRRYQKSFRDLKAQPKGDPAPK